MLTTLFIDHGLNRGRRKFKCRLFFLFEKHLQTPVENRRQLRTPTSADENPQPFESIERIEPFEHHKHHKHHKLLKPLQPLLDFDLLLICIKKGKLCKVVGAF